ncbi:MAG: hypothetical protein R3245_10535 [Kiloniellales bacterium]|nr:hypothetical protein [Kiloniellales bacterium]
MRLWCKMAIACGLTPIVLGTAIFAAWLRNDSDVLEVIGLLTIFGGVVVVAIGIVCLVTFGIKAREKATVNRTGTTAAVAVLALNFPLCAFYVYIAFAMESAYLVTVVNRSDLSIENLMLTDPRGHRFQASSVGPGRVHRLCPHFSGEGAVNYSFELDGEVRTGILIGYLADPIGSQTVLRLSEALTAEADEKFDRISLSDFLRYCVGG